MKHIIIIIILLITAQYAKAVNIYPFNIEEGKSYSEGRFQSFEFENNRVYSYYIIPNWAGRSEFVYVKKDVELDITKGIQINYDFIHDIFKAGNNLLLVAQRNDSLFYLFTESDLSIIDSKFLTLKNDFKPVEVKFSEYRDSNYLILINNFLTMVEIIQDKIVLQVIDSETSDFCISNNSVIYLSGIHGITSLKTRNDNSTETLTLFDSFDRQRIFSNKNILAIFGTNSFANSTNCKIIDIQSPDIIDNFWVETKIENIALAKNKIKYIKKDNNTYFLETTDIRGNFISSLQLPDGMFEPQFISYQNNAIYCIFRNSIIKLNNSNEIQFLTYYPVGEVFANPPSITVADNNLIISSDNFSQIFILSNNELWKLKKYALIGYNYIIPLIIILIIIGLVQLYRHQRRYVSEILELPSIGVVLIIDRNGRLVNKNKKARELLKIPYNSASKKSMEYYFLNEIYRPFLEMIQRSFKTRLDYEKRLNIIEDGDSKEWYCRAVIMKNLTGQFRGLIFTAFDMTEQLERKRLSNWAQLAHDMQTNLSTITLNAQQIVARDKDDENYIRKNKIIHQVNILFNRVRDIVTVGKSNKLNKEQVNSADICRLARSEFDEVMFPEVNFELNINDFLIRCDKNKLIRAIRNTIENGINALKNNKGTIVISCFKKNRYAFFSIKDDGIGMDENIRKKMLNPYFTTGSSSGGSGIGTMIMLHVVELHSGMLEIHSKKGEGTEIIFKIPIGKTNE